MISDALAHAQPGRPGIGGSGRRRSAGALAALGMPPCPVPPSDPTPAARPPSPGRLRRTRYSPSAGAASDRATWTTRCWPTAPPYIQTTEGHRRTMPSRRRLGALCRHRRGRADDLRDLPGAGAVNVGWVSPRSCEARARVRASRAHEVFRRLQRVALCVGEDGSTRSLDGRVIGITALLTGRRRGAGDRRQRRSRRGRRTTPSRGHLRCVDRRSGRARTRDARGAGVYPRCSGTLGAGSAGAGLNFTYDARCAIC